MSTLPKHAVALVAEDEPLLRMEAVDLLEDAGFTVLEAANTTQALRHLADTDTIELLYTDIEMPGPIDGIDLANEVAARWPQVRIVVCSGRVQPDEGRLPSQARFVSKPVSSALILSTVEKVLPHG
ncbi:response regulator [Aureimonas ureilytica]|uniref:response regulator n=1 Tax=Aureimonas ureilytica TaxID=401562 RepID=UPI00058D083A|nr:response regulator [Aureimonas ureilytica]